MTSALPSALPSELVSLPYFAILALGARSVRQVAPVFAAWDGATKEQARAISRAAMCVEELAASPSMVSRTPLWVSARQSTRLAAEVASEADMAEAPLDVLSAADAAAELGAAINEDGHRSAAAHAVCRTFEASLMALGPAEAEAVTNHLAWILATVDDLQSRAISDGWTDQSAVVIP